LLAKYQTVDKVIGSGLILFLHCYNCCFRLQLNLLFTDSVVKTSQCTTCRSTLNGQPVEGRLCMPKWS